MSSEITHDVALSWVLSAAGNRSSLWSLCVTSRFTSFSGSLATTEARKHQLWCRVAYACEGHVLCFCDNLYSTHPLLSAPAGQPSGIVPNCYRVPRNPGDNSLCVQCTQVSLFKATRVRYVWCWKNDSSCVQCEILWIQCRSITLWPLLADWLMIELGFNVIFSNKLEIHHSHEVTRQVFRCTWSNTTILLVHKSHNKLLYPLTCSLHC